MIKQPVKLKQNVKEKLSNLSIGTVHLNVKDLEKMKMFYHQIMGLDILKESDQMITLGKGTSPLITLNHRNDLSETSVHHAGLYHFAILFSSRGDLARTVYQILKQSPRSFSGSADHLVSEAFYFNDPEGNGIELYYDRDRSTWQWKNNQIEMSSDYIDPVDYLQKNIVLEEKNTEVRMGHMHLKVGDIDTAKQFYVDILGFEITAQLPGALFLSVDNYHHHIGMNTWHSLGATKRDQELGLKSFELIFSQENDFDSFNKRITDHKIEIVKEDDFLVIHDPWKNKISFKFKPN